MITPEAFKMEAVTAVMGGARLDGTK